MIALTEAYERAGEMDLALERIAQASLRMAGQSARQDVSFFSSSAYLNRKSKPTRFRFSKQRNSNGGGATHYGGSSSDQRTAAVGATHAGLLRLAGKSAEADAIEAANLKGFEASLWSNSYWSGRLTQRYTELGLYEDAARYAELEHGFRMASLRSDRMRGYSRTSHASFLVKLWRDAGEPERASEALAQLELEYRERLSKAETDKQRAQLLRTQAYFEFGTLHDLERAERSWEEALALDPEQAPANTVRAEWLRVAGKHQAALDELDRLHKSTPWKRVGLPISSRTTLALTEAALGRLDPLLLRSCLIEDPDGQFAEELRAALK
ncbi:MAG: tetratricopeptide (TPR) repeat protein [Planctomycetota bacterium]